MSRLQDVLQRGLAASRPAATAVANGTLYFSTDTGVTEQSNGTTWSAYSAAAASGVVLIEEKVCTGSTSTETFSSIPGTYRHLRVLYTARVTTAGSANQNLYVQVNGDTGANYDQQLLVGFSNTPGASNAIGTATPVFGEAPQASATAGMAGVGEMVVPYYAGTTFYKSLTTVSTARNTSAAAGASVLHIGVQWRNTAAITSLRVGVATSGNFASGAKFSLYGVT